MMMRNAAGSEAVRLDAVERRRARESARPSLTVVSGKGLDARVRQGVSPQFLARIKMVSVVVVALVMLGAVRVALCSQTVSVLEANASTRTDIKTATALEDDLQVQRSVLSSNARIMRIATENYGMVLAGAGETLDVSNPAPTSVAAADSSAADSASAADSTSDATASDEAGKDADVEAALAGDGSSSDVSSAGSNAVSSDELGCASDGSGSQVSEESEQSTSGDGQASSEA